MILYALVCKTCEHGFEGWFANSGAFDRLAAQRHVDCPECGSREIAKQIMAPAVRPSEKMLAQQPDPDVIAREIALRVREHIAGHMDYVGGDFAEEARAMFYGEQEDRPIWGEATAQEREALAQEGIPALPLPAPFTPKKPKAARRREPLN